jgi:hypothetical protein
MPRNGLRNTVFYSSITQQRLCRSQYFSESVFLPFLWRIKTFFLPQQENKRKDVKYTGFASQQKPLMKRKYMHSSCYLRFTSFANIFCSDRRFRVWDREKKEIRDAYAWCSVVTESFNKASQGATISNLTHPTSLLGSLYQRRCSLAYLRRLFARLRFGE